MIIIAKKKRSLRKLLRFKNVKIGKNNYIKKITKEVPENYKFTGEIYIDGKYYKKVSYYVGNKDEFVWLVKDLHKNVMGLRKGKKR